MWGLMPVNHLKGNEHILCYVSGRFAHFLWAKHTDLKLLGYYHIIQMIIGKPHVCILAGGCDIPINNYRV